MIESNLVTVGRNNISVGNSITKDRIYGTELTMDQTDVLARHPLYGPWIDSVPKTTDGRAIVDTSYSYKPNLMNMLVYPVIGNHQFNYMMHEIYLMMDECGCKGIYMDDFDIGYTVNTPGRADMPVCLVFDLKGKPVTPNVKMSRKGKRWEVDLKLSDWNEAAVIMPKNEVK